MPICFCKPQNVSAWINFLVEYADLRMDGWVVTDFKITNQYSNREILVGDLFIVAKSPNGQVILLMIQ